MRVIKFHLYRGAALFDSLPLSIRYPSGILLVPFRYPPGILPVSFWRPGKIAMRFCDSLDGTLLPFLYPSSILWACNNKKTISAGPARQITNMVWSLSGTLPAGRVSGSGSVPCLLRGLLTGLLTGLLGGQVA